MSTADLPAAPLIWTRYLLLGLAAGILGLDISIVAMVQKEPNEGEDQVDIIMLTHLAVERNINSAIIKIEKLPAVMGNVTRIRLEELSSNHSIKNK